MAEEERTLTKYATDADKSVRGKICYLPTQWIWWVVLPVRWVVSHIAGAIFGPSARKCLWHKILTPANFLTSVRFWLLAEAISVFLTGTTFAVQTVLRCIAVIAGFFAEFLTEPVMAISAFLTGPSLAVQTNLLFVAIITDFFDGPLARNNDEVTELGTYMDHVGDWSVVVWVIFLNFWYQTLPLPYLLVSMIVLPILFLIYIAKFREFYDPETSWLTNASAFAAEELQTDFWGRLQFGFLAIALFGGLFVEAARDPNFFFYGGMGYLI